MKRRDILKAASLAIVPAALLGPLPCEWLYDPIRKRYRKHYRGGEIGFSEAMGFDNTSSMDGLIAIAEDGGRGAELFARHDSLWFMTISAPSEAERFFRAHTTCTRDFHTRPPDLNLDPRFG